MTNQGTRDALLEAARHAARSVELLREVYLDKPAEGGRMYDLAEIAAIHIGAFATDLRNEADFLLREDR